MPSISISVSHILWIVSDELLSLLREVSKTRKVEMPKQGSAPAFLRGIDDVEAACRSSYSLGGKYLFERFHIPSVEWVRWAFLTENGFFRSRDDTVPTRRGRAVIDPRRGVSVRDSASGYYRGFSQRPESPPVGSERLPSIPCPS